MTDDGLCRLCSEPLSRLKWNANTDVLTCDNSRCGCFRRPIVSELRVQPKQKRKAYTSALLGDYDDTTSSSITIRLQRLREQVYTEEEVSEIL